MTIHQSVRVYNSDTKEDPIRTYNGVAPEDLKEHIGYNTTMRPGCALFIDGKCVYEGYLTKERCERIERQLKKRPPKIKQITRPYS